MATKKLKAAKESTSLPSENVKTNAKSETEKKSPVKKASEKPVEVEAPKTKKPAVQKEEKITEPIEKKTPRAKASKAAPVQAEKTEETSVVTKVEEAVKNITEKVSKPINKIIEAVEGVIHPNQEVEKTAPSEASENKEPEAQQNKLSVTFQLKYTTSFGQSLFITGNNEALGNGDLEKAIPMQYANNAYWTAQVELPVTEENISYSYFLVNEYGNHVAEKKQDKLIAPSTLKEKDLLIADTWNSVDYSDDNVETQANNNPVVEDNPADSSANFTHIFKVKAPQLAANLKVFITGNAEVLGNWSNEKKIFLTKNTNDGSWSINLDLTNAEFPLVYKYGVYNTEDNSLVELEGGDNRFFNPIVTNKKLTVVADGVIYVSSSLIKVIQ